MLPAWPARAFTCCSRWTVLFLVDQQAPILSKDVRLAVRKRVQEQARLAANSQQSSGALSHVWYVPDAGTPEQGGILKGIASSAWTLSPQVTIWNG